jgi:hypothetical protein
MSDPRSVQHVPEPDDPPVTAAGILLLKDLHTNLWAALRSTLDTDRVALSALWLCNLGGLIVIATAAGEPVPLGATVAALGVIDFFLLRIFESSRREVRRVVSLLSDVYADHGLGAYFDQLREDYYLERYDLRRQLCIVLFGLATVLGLVFGLS